MTKTNLSPITPKIRHILVGSEEPRHAGYRDGTRGTSAHPPQRFYRPNSRVAHVPTYKCNNVVNKSYISAVLVATVRITVRPIKYRLITKHNKPRKQLAKIRTLVFKKINRTIPLIQLSKRNTKRKTAQRHILCVMYGEENSY